jgi:hypothetical protein
MNEATFIKQNKKKWEDFEENLKNSKNISADKQAELYIKIMDDLAFSRTHFGNGQLTNYLNALGVKPSFVHLQKQKGRFAQDHKFLENLNCPW